MSKLLVVVDMQNDFITGALGSGAAQLLINPVKDFITNFEGDVVYTQDTHTDDYMSTQEGHLLPVMHCIKGTPGWDIAPELGGNNKKKIFQKNTFGSLEFGEWLKTKTFEEIHFIGVCTGICVISNAVIAKAVMPDAKIVIHQNLCACVTPESHQTALDAMETMQMFIE